MLDNSPEILASEDRACIVAPAGHGKTHCIAMAVALSQNGCQLILTHTHAGVKSIQDKLRELGVSKRKYKIDTIAGISLRYVQSFPQIAGIENSIDVPLDWNSIYLGATNVFSALAGKRILQLSYSGVYVDEYQDCNIEQHSLIMAIAEALPCRILGDPMQGIFGFGENELVNWHKLVFPNFKRLNDLETPWRWKKQNNIPMGEWLGEVREKLMRGHEVDLRNQPKGVNLWLFQSPESSDFNKQRSACYKVARQSGTIVAIHNTENQAHHLANMLGRVFVSMEELECKALISDCERLENSQAHERVLAIIEFASKCMTKANTELKTLRSKCEREEPNLTHRLKKNIEIALAMNAILSNDSISAIYTAFNSIETHLAHLNPHIYRRELWTEMKRSLQEYERGDYSSLTEVAKQIRDKSRIFGRRIEPRVISRTVLVKGLEFDHAIVLNVDELDAKNLYVAMTRGAKSLTLLSSTTTVKKDAPWG